MGKLVTFQELDYPTGKYTEVSFNVGIKRIGSTITGTIIIPGIAIALMSLLYLLLPKGGGERIPFLSTTILTEVMFLVMLTNFVPLSKELPKLGVLFLTLTLVLCIMTIPITILEWKVKKRAAQEAEEKV